MLPTTIMADVIFLVLGIQFGVFAFGIWHRLNQSEDAAMAKFQLSQEAISSDFRLLFMANLVILCYLFVYGIASFFEATMWSLIATLGAGGGATVVVYVY
ncbi:MAG: hypothetical protein MUP66_03360, partial [Candidatus Nanohaloarchaeota archaeon QJJ-5]|nr:hypothetical protein [Candidatus Nanohaloarchaeota archaeon QJJ-5]